MTPPVLSTIAQMVYQNEPALDFARIVTEVERTLAMLGSEPVTVDWTCDDLVTFTAGEALVVLACSDFATAGSDARPALHGTCLTVSVGHDGVSLPGAVPDQTTLCSRLVERIQSRFIPAAVLWHEVPGVTDADRVEDLLTALPPQSLGQMAALPPVHTILDAVLRTDQAKALPLVRLTPDAPMTLEAKPIPDPVTEAPPPMLALPEAPVLQRDEALMALRSALYPRNPPPPAPSIQMRLAAHCFNATLIMVWVPLGAAVLAYTLLRGEDIVMSSRMIAVTGTVMALATSPLGHGMRTLTGI